MALSEEKITAAINLWNDGKSAGDIAKIFKVTRGTIVGVIYRARMRGLDVKQKGPTKPKLVQIEAKPEEEKVEIVKEPVVLEIAPQKELTIYRLQQNQCKYPTEMSADNEQLFCGKPTEKSYCPEHHKLCHVYREPLKIKFFSRIK